MSAEPNAARPHRGGLFYGWYVSGAALASYFFSNGLAIFVPPNLYPRLIEDFGISIADVSTTGIITFLVSGITSPLVGYLIDRYGVIKVIRAGLVMLALSAAAYPFATSLTHLYWLHFGLGCGLTCAGLMSNVVLLSNWFRRHRGRAVGILVTGSSLAGFIMPLAIGPIVDHPDWGWRYGYGLLALLVWLVALPGAFFVMRQRPEELGLTVDGAGESSPRQSGPRFVDGVSLGEALKTVTFWCLTFGSFSIWLAITAINNQLTFFLESETPLDASSARWFYSLTFWFSVVGKFGFGYLSDRIPKRDVMLIASGILFVSCLFLFQPSLTPTFTESFYQLLGFTVLFGLGFGGTFTMIQMLCVDSFGQRDLGKIYGCIVLIDTAGAALGILFASSLKEATGSYLLPFSIIAGITLLAFLSMFFVRPVTGEPRAPAAA